MLLLASVGQHPKDTQLREHSLKQCLHLSFLAGRSKPEGMNKCSSNTLTKDESTPYKQRSLSIVNTLKRKKNKTKHVVKETCSKLNGTSPQVQHNDLTLNYYECNFAFPPKQCNITSPGTKHWQEAAPAAQDIFSARPSLTIVDIMLLYHSLVQKIP